MAAGSPSSGAVQGAAPPSSPDASPARARRPEPWTAVVTDPIDVADVVSMVGGDTDGAILLFLGTVRDHDQGRPVEGMRYDAYVEMADEVLRQIAFEAAARTAGGRVAVCHRVGDLRVGEVSVAIATSAPHRAEAYEASRWVIEEIKKRLPVWKKEYYTDGNAAWVEGRVPTP